jgi:cytidylate kinase
MYKIITIGREFGSAGKTIGKMVAEELRLVCYDKELISKVAEETGFDEKFVEQAGEYAPGKTMLSYILSARGPQGAMEGMMSMDEYLWASQRKVILDIAEKGPCVIIGRCADYILKDRNDCLSVFIHAGMDARIERIIKQYPKTDKSPEKLLEERDRQRKAYYKYFTGLDWGMSQNYHISLDRGRIGIDTCVQIILNLAKDHSRP